MAQEDTDFVETKKKYATQTILLAMFAAFGTPAVIWLFATVIDTHESTEVIKQNMPLLVESIKDNTKAVKSMDKDNVEGHKIIAGMVYSVREAIAKSDVRISNISGQLEKSIEHMDKHEQMIPKFEAWKSKVNLQIERCEESLKECENNHGQIK